MHRRATIKRILGTLNRRRFFQFGSGIGVTAAASQMFPRFAQAQAEPAPPLPAEIVRPQDFGARANGQTDDTDAIHRAWADLRTQDQRSAPDDGQLPFMATRRRILEFPPGDYVYSGAGLSQDDKPIRIVGSGSQATKIRLTDPSGWFLDISGFLDALAVSDITFQGGAGAIRFGNTGRNVASSFVIERCRFIDYNVAAITNQTIDHPQLRIRDCQFSCADGAQAIGISLGGLLDAGEIVDCDFWRNRYHVALEAVEKIGGASFFSIRHNSFLRFKGRTDCLADIWLIPKPGDTVNAMEGLDISGNRFGNENRGAQNHFLLVADAVHGSSSRADYRHSDEPSRGYVQGVRIIGNGFAGSGSPLSAPPLVASWSPNLHNLVIRNNHLAGSQPAFIVGYLGETLPDQPAPAQTTLFEHSGGNALTLKRYRLSDRAPGLTLDPLALLSGEPQVPEYWTTGADDPALRDLLTARESAGIEAGNDVVIQPIEDALGGQRAAAVAFRKDTAVAVIRFDGPPPVAGRPAWVELDIRAPQQNPLSGITVAVVGASSKKMQFSRSASVVDASWRRLRFLWWPTDQKESYLLTIRPNTADFAQGTSDRCVIGRPRIYQAREPLPSGHLRTIGSSGGTWDGEHIVLGAWHLWIDDQGKLRVKNGRPRNATDGSLVGA